MIDAAEEFTRLQRDRQHHLTQLAVASDQFQRGAAQLQLQGIEVKIEAVKQRLIAEGAIFPGMEAAAPVKPKAKAKRKAKAGG